MLTRRAVRAALAKGGQFMFETRNPIVQPWLDWNPASSACLIQSVQHGPVDVFHHCNAVTGPLVEFETHYDFRRDDTSRPTVQMA